MKVKSAQKDTQSNLHEANLFTKADLQWESITICDNRVSKKAARQQKLKSQHPHHPRGMLLTGYHSVLDQGPSHPVRRLWWAT